MAESFSDRFIPKPPINVPLPTFTKGMVRNKASLVIPEGGVYLASNWNVTEKGPTRRCGSIKFAGGATVLYAPVRGTVQLFLTAGTQRIGVLDARFLYLQSGASLNRMKYGTSAGTIRTSGANVRGNASTVFTAALLRAGDYIEVKPGTASAQELLIASVVTKSHLALATVPSPGPYASGAAYKVYKAFNYSTNSFVDWTVCDTKVVFADGARPLQAWNGGTIGLFNAALTFIPNCVTFWMDRLWCGFTIEGSTYNRSRTRWSKTTNHTSFIGNPDIQWQDRPYSDGALMRLVPMGKLLIGYYEDRIDLGRPTNIAGDLLPVAFEALDTGGAGLVGQRALARFYDGHFIMLDDGIYFFSAASGIPQNIGEEIWKDATKGLKNFKGVVANVDWKNESVLWGIPNVAGAIECLWRFNYKSKAWSRDEIPCTSLSTVMQTEGLTIDAAVGDIDSQTAAFDDSASSYLKQLAFGRAGAVNLLNLDASEDFDDSAITATLETGDFSWQTPNDVKSVYSLTLKTDRLMEVVTSFVVEGSVNRGLTWKLLGLLTIAVNDDENQVGFRLMGTTIRFRLTCSTRVLPFTIAEIVLRMKGRGRELRFSTVD